MRSLLPLLTALLLATLPAACASKARRDLAWNVPRDATVRYAFHTEHRVDTELTALPERLAGEAEVEALREALASFTFVLDGEFEQSLARVFRDGTWGQVIRIARAEGGQKGPQGLVPIESEGLVRKSVVVRGWPSGEVFELAGFPQMAGAGPMVELWFDLFTQLTIRLPRQLPSPDAPEREEPANVTLRIPLTDQASLEQAWSIRWRGAEERPCDGGTCLAMTYVADVKERSANRRPDRRTDVDGRGTVEGTVLLDASHRLVSHEYRSEMTRDIVTYEAPRERKVDGPVRATLRQVDRATSRIRRLP